MAEYVGRGPKMKLVLPFAVSAGDRLKAFTKDMEMAAIVYLAESDREKGEAHILKRPDEKLVFIAEARYPMWLVPWGGGTLIFDGLGASAHTLPIDTLPDVKAFNNDIKGNAKTSETYSAALSRNANYFKNLAGNEEKTIEGLVASPDFTQDLLAYLPEMRETKKPSNPKTFLSPLINESEISASVKELSGLRARIDEDVRNLDASMKLLSETTGERGSAIREEIGDARKKFDRQIARVKPRVEGKIRRIQGKYTGKITRISRRFERRLGLLHKQEVRLERMQRRLRVEVHRCEVKMKSFRRRKRKRSEDKWSRRRKRIKKRLPAIEKSLRDVRRRIDSVEAAKRLEVSQERMECESRIEEAVKILRELEASREARIRMRRQEIKSLEDSTSSILNQMSEMAKSKKAAWNKFERIRMPRRTRKCALVYLPFYFVRYEMEERKRYVVYPPSVVSGMGILTKMKGVLGAAKMKAFLQPRSKAITVFLNQLVTFIQTNPAFENEVTDAGIHDSLLLRKQLRIGVKRGLRQLRDEDWISKKELQSCSKLLYIYA